ncbi:MAG: Hsp33 family molecular chaperone HslO [Eubacteriales bacterium]|nr:Hsp33 family molecular chaperone HslO [Eubacteriales bacterium]
MSDILIRAIARDAGIQIAAAVTTGLVERARQIHDASPLAAAALGRTLTATAIMGDQLKTEDGSVTVQVKGDGPLGSIVCVGESDGYVRGYLQDPSVELPLRADGKLDVGGGVGRGYLMVIKDVGLKDPVTGTVALVNGEIAEDLTRYFAESEQIPSACALGVLVDTDRTIKAAGGWLVQLMPGVKDEHIDRLEATLAKLPPMTVMLEQGMALEQIVQTVLDGFEVGFLQTAPIGYRCACARSKVERALISMGKTELSKMAEEQEKSEVTCQFCDKIYTFTRQELQQLLAQAEK